MKYKATIQCFNSKQDTHGNCYYSFTYTDHQTGKVVSGTVSGGESNIYAIKGAAGKVLHNVDGWNQAISFYTEEMLIRPYDRIPHREAVFVGEHRPVHLPREAHGSYLGISRLVERGANRRARLAPPPLRILLGPAG